MSLALTLSSSYESDFGKMVMVLSSSFSRMMMTMRGSLPSLAILAKTFLKDDFSECTIMLGDFSRRAGAGAGVVEEDAAMDPHSCSEEWEDDARGAAMEAHSLGGGGGGTYSPSGSHTLSMSSLGPMRLT